MVAITQVNQGSLSNTSENVLDELHDDIGDKKESISTKVVSQNDFDSKPETDCRSEAVMAAPSKSTDAATQSGPSHLPTNVNTLGPLEGGVLEAEEDLDDKTDNKQEKAEMDAEDAF